MARPLRIEFAGAGAGAGAGALYHVTSGGDGREDIYLDNEDYELFLDVLGMFVDLLLPNVCLQR